MLFAEKVRDGQGTIANNQARSLPRTERQRIVPTASVT
jgi:hypothetical protein